MYPSFGSANDNYLFIEEKKLEDKVVLFPNPTSSSFTIQHASDKVIETVEIFNTFGQLLFCEKYTSNEVYIIHHDLPKGMYLVRINNSLVERLIIN